jgi:hypothetical protein
MKKIIIFALLAFVAITSCKKDEGINGDCEGNWGTIIFENNSNNPYEIFIDFQSQGTLQGNSSKSIKKEIMIYDLRAVQQSGYLLFPSEFEKTVTVTACENNYFVFP